MNPSRGRNEELCEALLSAYPSEVALKRLVRYGLKKNLLTLVRHDSLDNMVFQLIENLEAMGRFNELIKAAHHYNPGNPLLHKLHMEVFGYVRPTGIGSTLARNVSIWIGPQASWVAGMIVGGCVALGVAWLVIAQPAAPGVPVTSKDAAPEIGAKPPYAAPQPTLATPAPDEKSPPSMSRRKMSQVGRLDRSGATQQPKPLSIVEARHMTGSPSSVPFQDSDAVRATPRELAPAQVVDPQAPSQLVATPQPEATPSMRTPDTQANRALTAATKAQSPIFVSVAGLEESNSKLADALRIGLRQSGFVMAENRKQAVLLLNVFVLQPDRPSNDWSGVVSTWRGAARLDARLSWAGDNSVLFAETLDAEAVADGPEKARTDVLRQGVIDVIQKLNALTRN